MDLKKSFIGFSRAPVVGSEIDARPSGIAEEVSSGVFGIAAKQGVPVTSGAIDSFKPLFAARLDFELPED